MIDEWYSASGFLFLTKTSKSNVMALADWTRRLLVDNYVQRLNLSCTEANHVNDGVKRSTVNIQNSLAVSIMNIGFRTNVSIHFLRGEAAFRGGSPTCGGLGFDNFVAFVALLGAANFVGFDGPMFLVTWFDRDEDADDGKAGI
jgi:hypothetical protein